MDINDTFQWEQRYLKDKDSERAFSQYSLVTFQHLAKKYEKEVYPFVFDLKKNALSAKIPDVEILDDVLESIRVVVEYYNRLTGVGGPALTKEEIRNLRLHSNSIARGLRLFIQAKDRGDALASSIKKTEDEHALDIGELKRRQSVMTELTAKADQDRSSKWITPVAKMMQDKSGLKDTVMASVFGSFAPLASIALSGAGKVAEWSSKKSQMAQMKEHMSSLAMLGDVPEGILGSQSDWGDIGSRVKSTSSFGGHAAGRRDSGGLFSNLFGGNSRSEVRGAAVGSVGSEDGFKLALFSFFNEDAKKAWWTKRVIELLEKNGGGSGVEKPDTSFSSMLPNILKILGPALLVTAAGGIGVAIGSFINKLFPGIGDFLGGKKNSGKAGVFGDAFFGGSDQAPSVPQANPKDPESIAQKKVQTLTDYYSSRGMNVARANERARKEIGWHAEVTTATVSRPGASGGWIDDPTLPTKRPSDFNPAVDMPNPTIESNKLTANRLQENTECLKQLLEVTKKGNEQDVSSVNSSGSHRDPYDTGDPVIEAFMTGKFGTEE